jgi:hypothetical protein
VKKYQKTALLEVVERTQCGGYLVQNEGDSSDRWVIPQETFESTYVEVVGANEGITTEELADMEAEFGFDIAVCLLKEGEKVARKGWNGANMFAYYVPPASYPARMTAIKGVFEDDLVPYRGYFALKTVQNDVATWVPSGSDILAEDWVIVK